LPADKEYLESSRFVPWDDPLIQKLATEGGGDETDPSLLAFALEKFVRQTITAKNFSTAMATALEVAQTRAGDCTEHSVLLAALLRARGIPSRVAIGFVHSQSHQALVGHMWTEAYLHDDWIPLDGTMGRGGIGSGHLKVADSSLADEGTFPVSGFVPLIHLLGRTSVELIQVE
jgi:transglutaminase-like putative cysteine protease